MSAPDYYEQYLLGLLIGEGSNVVEVARQDDEEGDWVVSQDPLADGLFAIAPTLAAALTALLDDLGVEYEDRPSAEVVTLLADDLNRAWIEDWDDAFAREPLTVLALLAGDQ